MYVCVICRKKQYGSPQENYPIGVTEEFDSAKKVCQDIVNDEYYDVALDAPQLEWTDKIGFSFCEIEVPYKETTQKPHPERKVNTYWFSITSHKVW